MQLSWVLVGAVWCVFGRADAATIGERLRLRLQDGHLIGGEPVDGNRPEPLVAVLLVQKQEHIVKSCEASLVRRRNDTGIPVAYFLTAAECFDNGKDSVRYLARIYQEGRPVDINIYSDYIIYPAYNKRTKIHNLAVFSVQERYIPGGIKFTTEIRRAVGSNTLVGQSTEIVSWMNDTRDHELKERFQLYSLKSKVISTLWCKLFYPFSSLKEYHICASGWFSKGLTDDQIGTPLLLTNLDSELPGTTTSPTEGTTATTTSIWYDPTNSTSEVPLTTIPQVPLTSASGEAASTSAAKPTFWLVGIATIVRPWSSYGSFPIEFVSVAPYKAWIDSII